MRPAVSVYVSQADFDLHCLVIDYSFTTVVDVLLPLVLFHLRDLPCCMCDYDNSVAVPCRVSVVAASSALDGEFERASGHHLSHKKFDVIFALCPTLLSYLHTEYVYVTWQPTYLTLIFDTVSQKSRVL